MVWKPHVTVAAVVCKDEKFLMVEEHSEGKIVFNQPAGHMEDGENLIDAVIRETLEETAWHIEPVAITGLYQWKHPDKKKTFLRLCFHAKLLTQVPSQPLDDGIIRALWMSREELIREYKRVRSPMVIRCIDDFLSGYHYPLSLFSEL
ncbi:MAG: NUDIX hydrolase [Gammaproteobacteria bacterium]